MSHTWTFPGRGSSTSALTSRLCTLPISHLTGKHTHLLRSTPGVFTRPGLRSAWTEWGGRGGWCHLCSMWHVQAPSFFPQLYHSYTHPIWSLLICIKSQTSCSLSIQEMTAKVYSRNYIQWMGREKTHCFESTAWFPLRFHQTEFSKLFYYFTSFRNKVTSLNKLNLISAGYAAWSIQLPLLSTSPGLFSFAWSCIWTAPVSSSSGRPVYITEDHCIPVSAAREKA